MSEEVKMESSSLASKLEETLKNEAVRQEDARMKWFEDNARLLGPGEHVLYENELYRSVLVVANE